MKVTYQGRASTGVTIALPGGATTHVAHGDSIDVPAEIADQLCAQVGQWVKEPVKKSTKKPSTPTTED